jgi:hypothetical protein
MQKARCASVVIRHSLGLRCVEPWSEVLRLNHLQCLPDGQRPVHGSHCAILRSRMNLCRVVGRGKPLHGRDVLGCLHSCPVPHSDKGTPEQNIATSALAFGTRGHGTAT